MAATAASPTTSVPGRSGRANRFLAVLVVAIGCSVGLNVLFHPNAASANDDYWAGPYYGIIAGFAVGRADIEFATAGAYNNNAGDRFSVPLRRIPAGGFMGHNWLFGDWVLGIEASMQTHDVRVDDLEGPPSIHAGDHSYNLKTHWVGAFVGRVGYAAGPWLFYGEAGPAMAHPVIHIIDNDNSYYSYANQTRPALMWGAGVQYALGPRLSFGLGYRGYVTAPLRATGNSVDFTGTEVGGTETDHTVQYLVHTLNARIVYRFGESERSADWDQVFDWNRFYWGTIGGAQHQLGVTMGYDHTFGQILAGVSARAGIIAWGDFKPDMAISARIGTLIGDRFLAYGTSSLGLRFGDVGAELPVFWDQFEGFYWSVGAGFEIALSPRSSAFIEAHIMRSPFADTHEGNVYTGFNFRLGP